MKKLIMMIVLAFSCLTAIAQNDTNKNIIGAGFDMGFSDFNSFISRLKINYTRGTGLNRLYLGTDIGIYSGEVYQENDHTFLDTDYPKFITRPDSLGNFIGLSKNHTNGYMLGIKIGLESNHEITEQLFLVSRIGLYTGYMKRNSGKTIRNYVIDTLKPEDIKSSGSINTNSNDYTYETYYGNVINEATYKTNLLQIGLFGSIGFKYQHSEKWSFLLSLNYLWSSHIKLNEKIDKYNDSYSHFLDASETKKNEFLFYLAGGVSINRHF